MEVVNFLRRVKLLTASLGLIILGVVHLHGMFQAFSLVSDSSFQVNPAQKAAARASREADCLIEFRGREFTNKVELYSSLDECVEKQRVKDMMSFGAIAVAIDLLFAVLFFVGLWIGRVLVDDFRLPKEA